MDTVIRSSCRPGEYFEPSMGCRLCSLVQNPYQVILCPCEAYRDAVIGCKVISGGGNLCRQRSTALDECARRGFTLSVALPTTSSAGGTTSVASASPAMFTGDATQLRSMTVPSMPVIRISPTPASSDGIPLVTLGIGIGAATAMLCIITVVMLLCFFRQRRKAVHLKRRIALRDDQCEAKESSKTLVPVDSICSPTPLVVIHNEAAPLVSQKPSVVNTYKVTVKNCQFTQVGSNNVISVGERVASAILSGDELNSENEEQDFCTGGLDATGDSSLSRSPSRDATYSWLPREQSDIVFHPPLRDDFVDHREEDSACPCSGQKCHTSDMPSGDRTSRDEQRRSVHATLGPADAGTSTDSGSVTESLVRSKELSSPRYRANENATTDCSHLPTDSTNFFSQVIGASAKASPASLPFGGTDSSTVAKPLCNEPGDKECCSSRVSGQNACGTVVPLMQTSSALTSSRHVSMGYGGGKESLPVHPPDSQSFNAGNSAMLSELLTSPAVQNLDDDPNLPAPSTSHFQPPSVLGGLRPFVHAV